MENTKKHGSSEGKIHPVNLLPLVLLLAAAACAPATPSPEEVAVAATDNAYAATAHAINQADKATFAAKYPIYTRTPTPPARSKRVTPMNCAVVKENGTAYQALLDAHNGTLPGDTDPDGYPTEVQIDHKDPTTLNNVRFLMTLAQLLQRNPTVAEGDWVCYSADTDRLQQRPTPTPGPYQTPTPQPMSLNNIKSRTFAVSANRPVHLRGRG